MPDGRDAITVQVAERISALPAEGWDACAGADNPFVGHAFLLALEESGSVGAEAGWAPQHLAIFDEGRLVGCVPLYLKSHSYGEYVFDWGWADAYERAGGRYYPKLQSSIPFTPVTGPRLLVRPGVDEARIKSALISAMVQLTERHGISSLHITFPEAAEWRMLGEAGFLQRKGLQYHWKNEGYDSFDAFLATLSSRKRKAIKKERRKVAEAGVALRALSGAEIEPRHWDAFYHFYLSTADRKWGQPYLNREFFARLGETLADQVALVIAECDGRTVAGALNLFGPTAIYGRNWGCNRHFPFLHFEACYYQAIDFAIARGLETVEAGAQGEHKIQRGYRPVETYSAHWIPDPGFRSAVEQFLRRERTMIGREKDVLETYSPFRSDDGAPGGDR